MKPFVAMRHVAAAVRVVAALPADVVGWLVVLLVRLLWGRRLRWRLGALRCQLREKSWPSRSWYRGWGGTTVAPHAVFFGHRTAVSPEDSAAPGIIEVHEAVHTEQGEAACLGWSVVALCLAWHYPVAAAVVWCAAWPVSMVGGWLAAMLRGEKAYRGAAHEEGAYSQDLLHEMSTDPELLRVLRENFPLERYAKAIEEHARGLPRG